MPRRVSRRTFIKGVGLGAGWGAVALAGRLLGRGVRADVVPQVYLPFVSNPQTPAHARVVQVHARDATHWDFATGWYGDHVSQEVVNTMVHAGLMQLTGAGTVGAAWQALLPGYQVGDRIAMKVNLNNAYREDPTLIDALIEPVNAVIASLVAAGVAAEDVWVYDAQRPMPASFYGRRLYTQAHYVATSGGDQTPTFSQADASLQVAFSFPDLVTPRWLTDLLYYARYVINMPILKRHVLQPVTLGFKNHYGSLSFLHGEGNDNPHNYYDPRLATYVPDRSPLVDINANANIADKTVLTIGDGLFGAPLVNVAPAPWRTFGNGAPNSLFFARDRVAIDCVMCDLLRCEFGFGGWPSEDCAYDYLRVAQARGLGTFERGDPWGSGYRVVDYLKQEL